MLLKGLEQLVAQLYAVVLNRKVPSLVVEAGGDKVELLAVFEAENLGDLAFAVHFTVAKAQGLDSPVFVTGPGRHGVRVGIAQVEDVGVGHFAHILAEVEHSIDYALPVHDAAGAQGIAYALVNAVFQRNLHIFGEALQHADAHAVENVLCTFEGLAAVKGRLNLDVDAVFVQVTLAQLGDHVEVMLVDVGECDLAVAKFWDRHQVGKQGTGKADASRTDKGNFK